jgi:hypothetical protein
MSVIENNIGQRTVFNSFFGPVTFEPGINPDIHDRLWKNLKMNNLDVQAMLKKGLLVEVNETSPSVVQPNAQSED